MLVPSHSNSSQFYLDSLKIPLEGRFGFDVTINVPLQNTSQKKENIKNVNILTTIIEYRLHTKQVIWWQKGEKCAFNKKKRVCSRLPTPVIPHLIHSYSYPQSMVDL